MTNEKSIEIFHTALCNGLDYMVGYSLNMNFNKASYKSATEKLTHPCHEDVLVQILRDGGKLSLYDIDAEENNPISLEDVYTKMSEVPQDNLDNIINENDDAIDADCVLQTIFFGEIMFG